MTNREQTNALAALGASPWTRFAAGSCLLAAGVRSGSLFGGVLAATGGALLYRAVSRPAPDRADRRPEYARGLMVKKSIHVAASPDKCYRFWRELDNLSGFMDHLESVRVVSDTRSRWVARSVGGTSIEWDAEIVKDVPGRIIGWRSLSGSPLHTAGSVRFEPDGAGTQVVVTFKYDPPAGRLGAMVAELLGETPSRQLGKDLQRFRILMEKPNGRLRPSRAAQGVDPVDLASEDSFPASDPPSWSSATA